MAKFHAPEIQDNPSGWGPCAVPEKFKDMPYQPFSKGDRLGKVGLPLLPLTFNYKQQFAQLQEEEIRLTDLLFYPSVQVADWTGATYQDKRYTSGLNCILGFTIITSYGVNIIQNILPILNVYIQY